MRFNWRVYREGINKSISSIKVGITDKRNRPGVIFFTLLVLFGFVGVLEKYYVKNNGIYVIATILHVEHAPRGGYEATIKYNYLHRPYQKVVSFSGDVVNMESKEKRLVFSILSNHPTMIAFIKYAPDCLGDNPPEGWTEIPECE